MLEVRDQRSAAFAKKLRRAKDVGGGRNRPRPPAYGRDKFVPCPAIAGSSSIMNYGLSAIVRETSLCLGVFAAIMLLPLSAQARGLVDYTETWDSGSLAGWTTNGTEGVTLSNPSNHLNMAFQQQNRPQCVSETVWTGINPGPGTVLTSMSFRFLAANIYPSKLRLILRSGASGQTWSIAMSRPPVGEWVGYNAPLDHAQGWVTGGIDTEEQFLADIQSLDRVGLYILRHGSPDEQNYGMDDFRIQGYEESGITVTQPDAAVRSGAGKPLTVSWTGLWPIEQAEIVLAQGTNEWVLAGSLPSPTSNMTWEAILPADLEYGTNYHVRVADAEYPWDFGDSACFTVNFVDVTDITEARLLEETRYVNRFTGTIFATLRVKNKPDSGKRLQGDFWFAVQKTANYYLIGPDGTLADGKEYIDITGDLETAVTAKYGRLYLDPDEWVDIPGIEFYSRDRTVPAGFLYVLWADPDPSDEDRDKDGIPNTWENAHLLDPDWAADSLLDDDGDSMNNYAEYRAGTDPNDPKSRFEVRIELTNKEEVTGIVLQWHSITNRTYRVWRATNMLQGFLPLDSGITGTPPVNRYEDLTATNACPYFYKIEVE